MGTMPASLDQEPRLINSLASRNEGSSVHVFLLVPAQAFVGEFLQTFREYPQRQKAASFNLDEVLRKMQEAHHT